MRAINGQLHVARHFLLLLLAAVLGATSPWRVAPGVDSEFALYGALHASALVVSLRIRPSMGRQILFIAGAALLCVLTLRLGLSGMRFAEKLPGLASPMVVLMLASAAGALAYGVVIRKFSILDIPRRAIAASAALCLFAEFAAFLTETHFQMVRGLWLAIPWWFAFSGGLWYCDPRRRG
jgi:hypothetical protein